MNYRAAQAAARDVVRKADEPAHNGSQVRPISGRIEVPWLEGLLSGTYQVPYVRWRVSHGDDLSALVSAVPDETALQLIYALFESVVAAGWESGRAPAVEST